jgi:signal peptidase I
MANMFAVFLLAATAITGIVWFLEKFKWARQRKLERKLLERENLGRLTSVDLDHVTRKPAWIDSFTSLFPVLFIVLVVRSFLFEPFQIPSASMMPTLLIGDFILVVKFAYGLKDPLTQTTFFRTGEPKRGDVVVFKYPGNPEIDYIKRVVGLPGDQVEYDSDSKTVTITPACLSDNCERGLPVSYSDVKPSDFIQTFASLPENKVGDGFYRVPQNGSLPGGFRLMERQEQLGDVDHPILLLNQRITDTNSYFHQPGFVTGSWVVPKGEYFMMGDNRDNSADSRYWGFVPEKNLVGKAVAIWMSFEKQEGKWPTGVRLSRIGAIH